MSVNKINIPAQLTSLKQWILWAYEPDLDGKLTKKPKTPWGNNASSVDPQTWLSYNQALEYFLAPLVGKYDGIGFVFTKNDEFCGIDLDDCLTEAGELKPWAEEIVKPFYGTYAEISPSGSGIKLFIKGSVSRGVKKKVGDGVVEIYGEGRYFTVTGRLFPGFEPYILAKHHELGELCKSLGVDEQGKGDKKPWKNDAGELIPIQEGLGRDNFIISQAGKYRHLGWPEDRIYRALVEDNETYCRPPMSERILKDKARRICRYEPAAISPAAMRQLALESQKQYEIENPKKNKGSIDEEWDKILATRNDGTPKDCLGNAHKMLSASPKFGESLAWNEFSNEPVWVKEIPEIGVQAGDRFTDDHATLLTVYMEQSMPYAFSKESINGVIDVVAKINSSHPVRNYLRSIVWDGTPRIDTWLIDNSEAKDNEYVRTVSRKWLIQAVARIMEPGCKADCCLVLGGSQGVKKSSVLRILATGELSAKDDSWFSDEAVIFDDTSSQYSAQGVWILELGEFDSMTKGEQGSMKKWIVRQADKYVPKYQSRKISVPRQCVLAATVNPEEYLNDMTGARRFWTIELGSKRFDLDALRANRDQIWAEAVAAYDADEKWYLDDRMHAWAENEAKKHLACNEVIYEKLVGPLNGIVQIKLADVIRLIAPEPRDSARQFDKMLQKDVKSCLSVLGFKSKHTNKGNIWERTGAQATFELDE